MKTKESTRINENARRRRLLAAGMCIACKSARCDLPGFTSDRCAICSQKQREFALERMRRKRGTSADLPIVAKRRGPRENGMTLLNRSDVYEPEKYKAFQSGRRKRGQKARLVEPRKSS